MGLELNAASTRKINLVTEQDQSEYTIGEAAEILQVSTRTLRHWDDIELLTPSWRTWGDHRLYSEEDVERGMNILIYRGAGVALKDIAELIDATSSSRAAILRNQRKLLLGKVSHMQELITAVDALLTAETLKEGKTMSTEDKIALFGENWPVYDEEARQRWGDTEDYAANQKTVAQMSKEDIRAAKQVAKEFKQMLIDARTRAVAPGSDEAKDVADKHMATISPYMPMSRSKQVLLARMYVADDRFSEAYGENREYLKDLIEAQAKAEGIDLGKVNWE